MSSLAVSSYDALTSLIPSGIDPQQKQQTNAVKSPAQLIPKGVAAFGGGDAVIFSESHFVSEYVYFVASMSKDVQEGKTNFADKVDEISKGLGGENSSKTKDVAPVKGAGMKSSADGTSIELSAEFSSTTTDVAAVAASGDTVAAAAYHSEQLHAELHATVTTKDGTTVEFSAEVDVSVEVGLVALASKGGQQKSDPLALDINGDGQISLTNVAQGAAFDINGDGSTDQTAFVNGGDVFLALDRNGNGKIDDGHELFGDQNGQANGFLALSRFDEDHNGIIDSKDSVYKNLVGAWLGDSGKIEQKSLSDLGVQNILLGYSNVNQDAQGGNSISQVGSYTDFSGKQNSVADVLLNYTKIA